VTLTPKVFSQRHFERLQLLHLNTEMVIKQGFSVLMAVVKRVYTVFERQLENFERPVRSLPTFLKK